MTIAQRLEGRSIFVTGGGSGIGRGAAERLAEEGARVALADIRADTAEEAAAAIRDAGDDAIGVACDVADEASVASAIEATVGEFGGLWGGSSRMQARPGADGCTRPTPPTGTGSSA